jgi:transposase
MFGRASPAAGVQAQRPQRNEGERLGGIAPVTRTSGSSIKGEHPARAGNRKLKRAFFLAAFAA